MVGSPGSLPAIVIIMETRRGSIMMMVTDVDTREDEE